MGVSISTIIMQDITLLYESLDLESIDIRELKTLIGDLRPTVVDAPNMIAVIYPPIQLVIQLADRRIRITNQKEINTLGELPLWKFAQQCQQIASESQLIAYGFNYNVQAETSEEDIQEITKRLFVSDSKAIDNLLEARLTAFIPKLRFEREEAKYDLTLEPLNKQAFKAHINAHFTRNVLPKSEQLEASFREEFDYFVSLLNRLFSSKGEG